MQAKYPMAPITIQETLLDCAGGRVVLACDADHRAMLGVSPLEGQAFVQIDRVTMLELERGMVDLHTVMTERCAGIAVAA
jgi:hypothetical protein